MVDSAPAEGTAAALERLRERVRERLTVADQPGATPVRVAPAQRPQNICLSSAQQRLWFLDQDGASAAYNLTAAVRLRGRLDRTALHAALNAIVERHESLRSIFTLADGEPVQVIRKGTLFELTHTDISALAPAVREERLERLCIEESRTPFMLAVGPPIRGRLIALDAGDHVLLLSAHHIVMDGWSRGILLREVMLLYAAFVEGRPNPLPALEMQFTDFALWQRTWQDSAAFGEQLRYWRNQLQDAPVLLELPADRPRPRSQSYRGGSIDISIDARLTREIGRLARRHDATVFMVLQAAFALVLSRLSGQDDIVIGTPIANRRSKAVEGLVGCFLNSLALRIRLDDDTTVGGLLREVRQTTLAAYRHQDLPFERLVAALERPRRADCSPVFQVLLGLQNTPQSRLQLPQLEVELRDFRNGTATVDLTLFLEESGDVITGSLNYAADLFDRPTIERWAGYFQGALVALAGDDGQRVQALPLVSETEAMALLERFSPAVSVARGASIHSLFEAQVVRRPEALAVTGGAERLTFAQLNVRANQLAHYLRARGVAPAARVAVLLPRGVEMIVAQLALLKCGCTYVPVDPEIPRERQEFILRDCADAAGRATMVIAAPGAEPHAAANWIDVGAAAAEIAASPVANFAAPSGRAPAYVMYTSGSTGTPKGAIVGHDSVIRLCVDNDYIHIDEADCIAHCSNPAFDASTFEIWAALLNGGRVSVVSHFVLLDTAAFERVIVEEGISVLFLTTALFNHCVRVSASIFAPVRCVLFGGEIADPGVASLLLRRGRPRHLLHMYGPTETTTFACCHEVTAMPDSARSIPIGRPIAGTRMYVLDQALRPVPVGVVGEIFIGGAGVAQGYLNRPELTAERFVRDPFQPGEKMYRTGDRARWLHDGNLEYVGRKDQQIKIRGFRVEPGEIETQLVRHPDVKDAVVIAAEAVGGERQLVAYVTGTAGATPRAEDLRAHLRTQLPDYMIPAAIVCLPRLPLTPNGKVDRRALPVADFSGEYASTYVAPRNARETALCELWRSVLAVERVGATDDFFLLGGNSLSAVRLISLIQQQFGKTVPLRQFMLEPRVEQLALHLGEEQQNVPVETLSPDFANQYEPFPLTPIQLAYWVGRNGVAELSNVGAHAYAEIKVPRLDAARFEATLNAMVRRHAALRTVVLADARQQVLATIPEYRVAVDDLRRLASEPRQERLASRRAAMSHQVFDGGVWPLFDVVISQLSEEDSIVHVSLDALVLDASSAMVLLDEFVTAYREPQRELPRLELSFRDYVLARESFARSALYQAAREYWLARVPEFPGGPDLPLAKEPGQITHPKFERRSCCLPAEQWQVLVTLAQRHQVTPTVLLLTCFAEVLGRWSQQAKFALNLTLFNRMPFHPQVEAILGDFTTLVLLELGCRDRSATFADRLRANQQQLWSDLEHRYFDGMEMLQALRKRNGATAGYPVVMTSTLGVGEGRTLAMLRDAAAQAENYSITQTSQVWLDMQVAEQGDGLRCNWDSVIGLFPDGMLDAMFAAFNELLARLAHEQRCWHGPVEVELPLAQSRAIDAANATGVPLPAGMLHTPVLRQMRTRGAKTALRTPAKTLSYRELELRSRKLAHELSRGGARPDQLVAIVMTKGWQQVVAAIGVLRAGAAYLPIDANQPAERIAMLLANGEARQVVTTPALRDRCPAEIPQLFLVADAEPDCTAAEMDEPPSAATPADLAYVIFTSGSTGVPKGVMIEHRAALNTVEDVNLRHRITESDSVFGLSSLSFDLSVFDIFGVLGAGGTLVLPGPEELRDPAAWMSSFAAASAHGPITVWNTVPALMQMLIEYVESRRARLDLRLVMLSGDWIPVDLPARIRALAPTARLISLGGATEAAIWSIEYPIADVPPHWKSIPYGKPLANQTVYVLQEGLRRAPFWVAADLYIGGAGVARGYWRDEAKTAASFVVHPATGERLYRTGDRGRLLPDGNIEFLGRQDLQVKIRGYRIELGEVEACLAQHSRVKEVLVMARADGAGGKSLVAYVTGTDPAPDAEDLRAFLRAKLPDYMLPEAYVLLDGLPLTANGKIDAKALPAPQAVAAARRVFEAPQSDTEQALAAIWCELLQVDRVGRQDHFFDLGGNSLLAVQCVARIRGSLGVELPLREIFAEPELAPLAEKILDRQVGAFDPEELLEIARQAGMQQRGEELR